MKTSKRYLKFVVGIVLFCWPLIAPSNAASQPISQELLKNLTYRNIGRPGRAEGLSIMRFPNSNHTLFMLQQHLADYGKLSIAA